MTLDDTALDATGAPPGDGARGSWPERLLPAAAYAAMLAACAQAVWKTSLWKAAEPRVMTIAREQLVEGLLRSLTFAGMPFLEKPPLYYDLTAVAFHAAGGPSILAARLVVALLSVMWVAAIVVAVRAVAGARAGMLAGVLLVVTPAFAALVRRLGVDVCMVSFLSLAMAFLVLAAVRDPVRIHRGWLAASIAAAGCAALSKGVFGTFLYVAPTLAYVVLARDWRLLRAFLRPSSVALLLLPHVLWGAVLHSSGGWTYVFEHFVNNTVGRVLHTRFEFQGTHALPYGDVGGGYDWWYYLRFMPTSALPAVLAVPFAIAQQRRRGGWRATDPVSRLLALCLCWGVVPPLLLSFSSYKGRGHLAASSAALVVVGVLWLAPRLAGRGRREPAAGPAAWTAVALYALAPGFVVAACLGLPSTPTGARVAMAAVALVATAAIVLALRRGGRALAVHLFAAAAAVCYVVDFSPGSNAPDDAENSMDPVSRWVAAEAGDLPVAVFYPHERPLDDRIGWSREDEVATLTYWLGRPVVRLRSPVDVRAYLGAPEPGLFVARRRRDEPLAWPRGEPDAGWVAVGGNRDEVFVLVANRALAATRAGPRSTPPDLAAEETRR